ncbi:MAG: hypothetical protein ACTHKC_04115 [Candidatus Nitrosocosmicus sp.]
MTEKELQLHWDSNGNFKKESRKRMVLEIRNELYYKISECIFSRNTNKCLVTIMAKFEIRNHAKHAKRNGKTLHILSIGA